MKVMAIIYHQGCTIVIYQEENETMTGKCIDCGEPVEFGKSTRINCNKIIQIGESVS